jgi:hypothetical protein
MIPKSLPPHPMRGGHRLLEEIMLERKADPDNSCQRSWSEMMRWSMAFFPLRNRGE